MKKYYMSFVDFSEIINVTADEEQLTKACDRMAELELLTEKGNPSTAQIGIVAQAEAGPFYDKLKKADFAAAGRHRRRQGHHAEAV